MKKQEIERGLLVQCRVGIYGFFFLKLRVGFWDLGGSLSGFDIMLKVHQRLGEKR